MTPQEIKQQPVVNIGEYGMAKGILEHQRSKGMVFKYEREDSEYVYFTNGSDEIRFTLWFYKTTMGGKDEVTVKI